MGVPSGRCLDVIAGAIAAGTCVMLDETASATPDSSGWTSTMYRRSTAMTACRRRHDERNAGGDRGL